MIRGRDENGYKRPEEQSPEPGQYQVETVTFAKNMQNVDFGGKYETKYDKNPAVGQYDVEGSMRMTQTKSYSAKIVSDENGYKRPEEQSPEPGQYQ